MFVKAALASLLAVSAIPPVLSCAGDIHKRSSPGQDAPPPHLTKRVGLNAKCGAQDNGAVCDGNLCCSEAGLCGTGSACGAPSCQLSFGPGCDGNQTPPGKDTSKLARPKLGNVPYGAEIFHCTVKGKVALTFDDGPYIYTADLLDLLKRNNAKATFYVVGNNGGKGFINNANSPYRDLIKRMYIEGHQIASHSWSHQDLSAVTPEQRVQQIVRNEIALGDILGFFPTYFRPPYSRSNPGLLADLGRLGYHLTNFDVDTRDWQGDATYMRTIYSSILSQHSPANSQWLAIAHDIQSYTVKEYTQYMIDTARKLGYELVTVGACLGDDPKNWYRDAATGDAWTGSAPVVQQQRQQPSSTGSATGSAVTGGASRTAAAGDVGAFRAGSSGVPTVAPAPAPAVVKASKAPKWGFGLMETTSAVLLGVFVVFARL